MTLARRFSLLISLTFIAVIGLTAWLAVRLADYSAEAGRLTSKFRETLDLNSRIRRGVDEEDSLARLAARTGDLSGAAALRDLQWSVREELTRYLKLDIGDEERLTLEKIKRLHADVDLELAHLLESLRGGEQHDAQRRLERLEELEDRLGDTFEEWNAVQLKKLQGLLATIDGTRRASSLRVFLLVAGLLGMLVVLSVLFRKHVLSPLHDLEEATARLRRGDLTARAPVRRSDEIGRLTEAFNYMAGGLEESYATMEKRVEERTRELQDVQQQLVQTAKLSALGELVSGVAHELNNPLTSILGFAELELHESKKSGSSRQAKAMQTMVAEAERCRSIVRNLLLFARRKESRAEPVAVNAMVEAILSLREYELKTGNVRLVRELDPLEPVIAADAGKLQQVVLNLVNNAYDALRSQDPGASSSAIVVRTAANGETLVLEVEDDGPGLAEPDRVFDPFYTTKPVGEGTGLGLSVCYGIVQEHGGTIEARNTGKGALLRVTLPRGRPEDLAAAVAAVPAAVPAPVLSSARRALVVDDEGPLLSLQIAFLERLGITATGVGSGGEAIRYLESSQVDMVISDIRMPGVDGPSLLDWVRAHRPELAGHFLFTSGDATRRGEAPEKLDVPTLWKPFRFEEYSRAVRTVLEAA